MQDKDLIKEYYQDFDIEIFYKKLKTITEKISSLKKEKSKKVYYTELYSTYIQIVEIFCINSFAISEKDIISNIFLGNSAIQKKIESRFFNDKNNKGQSFTEYLVDGFVFNLTDESKDRTQQTRNYVKLTKEAVDDYLKDRDFLNSYKHGFRVLSSEKNSLSVEMTGGKSKVKLADYSASVIYYKKDKKTDSVMKCNISFNWERVYAKSLVLLNILVNMRRTYLQKQNDKVEFLTFNNKLLDSKYGCFRTCTKLS